MDSHNGIMMFSVLFFCCLPPTPSFFFLFVSKHPANSCKKMTFLISRCFSSVVITSSEPIITHVKLRLCCCCCHFFKQSTSHLGVKFHFFQFIIQSHNTVILLQFFAVSLSFTILNNKISASLPTSLIRLFPTSPMYSLKGAVLATPPLVPALLVISFN